MDVAAGLFMCTLCVIAVVYLAGIRQNLPFYTETDEDIFTGLAANMVAAGSANPGWFGNPASTLIYPMAILYTVWNALFAGGPLLGPDPAFGRFFGDNPSSFYILGRMVSIAYGLMSVPLLYLISRRLFGSKTALLTVWLSGIDVMYIAYAQVVRSDSAGLFFSLLSVWFALKYHDRPNPPNRLLAGAAVGLAASSRYFMAFFILPLLIVEGLLVWGQRGEGRFGRHCLATAAIGPLAAGLGFALSSPFFFLDFGTALRDLTFEARGEQMGFDGLSPLGNFVWYLTWALPWTVTWPQLGLVLGAVLVAIARKDALVLVAAVLLLVYTACISVTGLHQQRWLMQVLPVVAVLAASCLVWGQERLAALLSMGKGRANVLLGVLLLAVLGLPAYDAALYGVRQAHYSTRIAARQWAIDHWPRGATAVVDAYTVHFLGEYSLRRSGKKIDADQPRTSVFQEEVLESYVERQVGYIVVSDEVYNRTFAEPDRYAVEAASYRRLFADYSLVAEFKPAPARPGTEEWINLPAGRGASGGGPIIRVYAITP